MHDFITRCLGHLENTGSLNYADLPIVNSFLFPVKKKIIYNQRKCWEVVKFMVFKKSNFCFGAQVLLLQQILLFFLK